MRVGGIVAEVTGVRKGGGGAIIGTLLRETAEALGRPIETSTLPVICAGFRQTHLLASCEIDSFNTWYSTYRYTVVLEV